MRIRTPSYYYTRGSYSTGAGLLFPLTRVLCWIYYIFEFEVRNLLRKDKLHYNLKPYHFPLKPKANIFFTAAAYGKSDSTLRSLSHSANDNYEEGEKEAEMDERRLMKYN